MSQSKKLKKTRATKRGTFLGSAGDWFGLVSSCYVWKVGGRRALTMQIYLRSSLVVIGQLVEVFIVPFFILMSNVHRENMQTQKNIINSWKWRAVKHSNKSPLFCFKLGSLTVGLAKNIRDVRFRITRWRRQVSVEHVFNSYIFRGCWFGCIDYQWENAAVKMLRLQQWSIQPET